MAATKYYSRENRRHRDLYRWHMSEKAARALVKWLCKQLSWDAPACHFDALGAYEWADYTGLHLAPETRALSAVHELAHWAEVTQLRKDSGHKRAHRILVDLLSALARLGLRRTNHVLRPRKVAT